MTLKKIEVNDFEKELIIKGLTKISDEADKLMAAAERINIEKAADEAKKFKIVITELIDKVAGRAKLV
jgi:hypothetical protein